MKVVIVTPYWLQTKGGITSAVYHLSERLMLKGHSVLVITTDRGSGAVGLPKNRFVATFHLLRLLQKFCPDIVHVHACGFLLLASVLYKILLNHSVNLIFTFHTQPHTFSFLKEKPARERGCLRQFLFNYLIRHCDVTTYVSRSLMSSLDKTGVKIVRPVIIPNGVEVKFVSKEHVIHFKQKYDIGDGFPILCMIAKFEWDWKVKGIQILIRAVRQVVKSQQKAKLLIVGDGRYRKLLEDYVQKECLEKQVVFTGNLDNPYIALASCSIYCHISLNEALGIAPLEAMAMGKPVVVSNDMGLPEIVSDGINGILVDSTSDSVAKAILNLSGNSNLMHQLSKNARITAATKFSWEKIAARYENIYQGNLSKCQKD